MSILNLKQREAVEDTDGPLIIIAGAGTGKTRVITEKILHLIDNKKIAPRNILALTFSNRAASEMQDRVNSSLSSYYYDLEITTFHAFGNRILQEYGFHIGIPLSFKLLDSISQIIFMQKIYEKFNFNYYYSLSSPLSTLSAFTRFFSRCKDEIVYPSDFIEFVNLKENDYKNKMDTLCEEEKASRQMELEELKERANVYKIYQEELTSAGCMDFSDLILNSILLLKKRPQILSHFQERYKYILVDEFQDTNIAQIELLKMLAGKHRNISVVGDDDQSIYHFRGASYASFMRFNKIFPDAKKITLNQNYRSTDKILNLANEVISLNASSRFDPDKKLFTEKKEGKKINILTAEDYIFEAEIIAEKIKTIYNSLSGSEKKWEDFAVLYRAHTHKDKLVDVFKKENIPFQLKGSLNLFSNPIIKNLVALLKIIHNPDDSVNMFKILSELCNLSWEEKLYLNQISKQKEISLFQTINIVLQSYSTNTSNETLFIPLSKKSINDLNTVKNYIGNLFEKALEGSLQETFFEILKKSGDIEKLYVKEFFSIITDFIENNPEAKLKEFIEYLEVFNYVGGTTPSENLPEITPAVQMMSIHACKGLEFPYVFVIGLVSRRFPATEKEDSISLPDELIKGPIPEGDYHIQEERRLFYVALTRACKELYLTCIEKNRSPASVFIKEIKKMNLTNLVEEYKIDYNDSPDIKFILNNISNKDMETLNKSHEDIPLCNKFSYTHLKTYENCPLQYKYRYIMNIPVPASPVFSFGNIMHSTLEEYFMRVREEKYPEWEELKEIFEEKWSPIGFKNLEEIEKNKKIALKQLKDLFDTNKKLCPKPVKLEQKFEIEIGGVKIIGRIDRIDKLDENNNVEIIDYKTGKSHNQKNADKDMQLSIYAIACMEQFGFNPAILSFYYLSINQKISTTRNEKELINTKNKIMGIIKNIQKNDFSPTPSSFNCKRCDYKDFCNYSQ